MAKITIKRPAAESGPQTTVTIRRPKSATGMMPYIVFFDDQRQRPLGCGMDIEFQTSPGQHRLRMGAAPGPVSDIVTFDVSDQGAEIVAVADAQTIKLSTSNALIVEKAANDLQLDHLRANGPKPPLLAPLAIFLAMAQLAVACVVANAGSPIFYFIPIALLRFAIPPRSRWLVGLSLSVVIFLGNILVFEFAQSSSAPAKVMEAIQKTPRVAVYVINLACAAIALFALRKHFAAERAIPSTPATGQ